jgi:hypothetical protein
LEKRTAQNSIEREKGAALEDILNLETEDYQKRRRERVIPFEDRRNREFERIEREYQREKSNRQAMGLWLARTSPAGALVSFFTEMANTGATAEAKFLLEAYRYREIVEGELFDKIIRDVFPSGAVRMGLTGPIDIHQLPEFTVEPPALAEGLRETDLALLLGWIAVSLILVYLFVSRYDVR